MTPELALAVALWRTYDYAAPVAPEDGAARVLSKLRELGYDIVKKVTA